MKEDCDRPALKSFAAGTSGISLLGRGSVEGRYLGKKTGMGAGEPTAHPKPQAAASARLPRGTCDGVKDNPRTGTEANAMERKPMILDYFSRALRQQPAGPHTDTPSHRPVKTSVGETASCSKIPCGQPQHFPAQEEHLVGVVSDAGPPELHISSKTHCSVFGVFLLTTAPIILRCASLIYLPSCVSGAYCWFTFSPWPALKEWDWSQHISI